MLAPVLTGHQGRIFLVSSSTRWDLRDGHLKEPGKTRQAPGRGDRTVWCVFRGSRVPIDPRIMTMTNDAAEPARAGGSYCCEIASLFGSTAAARFTMSARPSFAIRAGQFGHMACMRSSHLSSFSRNFLGRA